ncbi:MAG: Bax inhibitor-1/YccA family protein [Chlamydiota bacterium]|nr:Bax inhibitor-1/YccA family protein [Chlamydiota bacterium]
MRSANPALNDRIFPRVDVSTGDEMTIQGTVNKTAIMLFLVICSASFTWHEFFKTSSAAGVMGWVMGGAIGGFIVALITIFKKNLAPYTAPIYAILEGLLLGGISALYASQFHGIVVQAVGLTFGTLFAMLMAYKSGMIRVTEKFKMGVVAATGGICLLYIASIIMGFFGVNIPFIHSSGTFGILFSLFVVVVAALNLVIDFDFIEKGAAMGAPKYMEWYGAFGLMVTLIWLYLEMLRLLAKLQSRR